MRKDLLALAVVKVVRSVVTAHERGSAQADALPFAICELVTPSFVQFFFFPVSFVGPSS